MPRVFIAGIIQGSKRGKDIHSQDYRERLRSIFSRYLPEWEVYCPVANHPDSVNYDDEEAKKTFLYHVDLVRHSQLLVAYLPEASMGTAIEMWEAYKSGVPVWSITPMRENWVVRITSERVFSSIDELELFLSSGGVRWIGRPL